MKTKMIAAGVSAALLAACATPPEKIAAASIPTGSYATLDCAALAAEQAKNETELAAVSKQQNEAVMGDAVGVFLIGVPMTSAMGGDKETEVAVAKGKIEGVKAERIRKGCA
jgi:hypothetical protein